MLLNSRTPLLIALVGALTLAPSLAAADQVHLKDGRVLNGKVTELPDNKLRVELKYGPVVVKRSNVKKIVKGDLPAAEKAPAKTPKKSPAADDAPASDAQIATALRAARELWTTEHERATRINAFMGNFLTIAFVMEGGVSGGADAKKKRKATKARLNGSYGRDVKKLEKLLGKAAPKMLEASKALRASLRSDEQTAALVKALKDLKVEPTSQAALELIHRVRLLASSQAVALEVLKPKFKRSKVMGDLRALRADVGKDDPKASKALVGKTRLHFNAWELATKTLFKSADDYEDEHKALQAAASGLPPDRLDGLFETQRAVILGLRGRGVSSKHFDKAAVHAAEQALSPELKEWSAGVFWKALKTCMIRGEWSSLTKHEKGMLKALRRLDARLPDREACRTGALTVALAGDELIVFVGDQASLALKRKGEGWSVTRIAPQGAKVNAAKDDRVELLAPQKTLGMGLSWGEKPQEEDD